MARKSIQDDTQTVEEIGLPGTFDRSIKVTMMGAGSGFTEHLMKDIALIPGSQGGADSVDNLQILCRSCNRRKAVRIE